MYNNSAVWKSPSSLRGWIQSTGHTSTHAVSLVLMHGSQITYAIRSSKKRAGCSARGAVHSARCTLHSALSRRPRKARRRDVAEAHRDVPSQIPCFLVVLGHDRPIVGRVPEDADPGDF